jgi:hypothetical protein
MSLYGPGIFVEGLVGHLEGLGWIDEGALCNSRVL